MVEKFEFENYRGSVVSPEQFQKELTRFGIDISISEIVDAMNSAENGTFRQPDGIFYTLHHNFAVIAILGYGMPIHYTIRRNET